ncbi:MAG: SGNH/GDSL hydrolase family protein [Solirubrobacteraceae bacterium]|nr:SGNH/GDSL hydrolase family protein [Solirubrobacteraceae bacterium]
MAAGALALGGLTGCGDETPQVRTGALNVVSLGDSLAVGVQPQLAGSDRETSQGYPRQLANTLREQDREVDLWELGCGGATSGSVISGGLECAPGRNTPYDNEDPSTSQLSYAEGLISTLGDAPTVVVLDIGGNDVGSCLRGGAILESCVTKAGRQLRTNLDTILRRLRAIDPDVPIAVMDLYDPFLGLWKTHPEARSTLVRIHAVFLRDVNQVIARVAARRGALVAKVGTAMRQDTAFTAAQTTLPPAVDAVCKETWMCVEAPLVPNIHLRRSGYGLAAEELLRVLTPSLGEMGR